MNSLSVDKVSLMEELDFVWDPYTQKWDKMYQQLKKYKEDVSVLLTYMFVFAATFLMPTIL
jgi:hypothetical protein